ncbi:fimbrin-like isoform X1 [Bolinopsis microptera]|uniref:fimbrin-like isoform X1 n=1 Tax=Bolinopsis microptera TaxID=2820187 RepID=UPI00307AD71D
MESVSKEDAKQCFADDEQEKKLDEEQEKVAFVRWINKRLKNDRYLTKNYFKKFLPLKEEGDHFFDMIKDGILLSKLINDSVPGSVDERALNYPKTRPLNYFMMLENQNLVLNSCVAIGCRIVNIKPEDMVDGVKQSQLNVVWQVIRAGLMAHINLKSYPGLKILLNEGETVAKLMAKTPEDLLVRWVNFHMRRVCDHKQIKNFYKDIQNGEAYTYLFTAIAPQDTDLLPLRETDLEDRMDMLLEYARDLDVLNFVTPRDIIKGNIKLNTAFIAQLFNAFPSLEVDDQEDQIDDFDEMQYNDQTEMFFEETREEKSFRHWLNSLNFTPYVSYLYEDLKDGYLLLQVFNVLKPGMVNQDEINVPPFKPLQQVYHAVENCNYCITLGSELGFVLVGIEGNNIYEGNKLLLSLLWQMMRYYTLSLMTYGDSDKKLTEQEVIEWCNKKLKEDKVKKGRHVFRNFRDSTLTSSQAMLDLIDIIQPGSIGYDMVAAGITPEDKLENARYCLTMARKIGATVFALPEDIIEGNNKMIGLVFARLMKVGANL